MYIEIIYMKIIIVVPSLKKGGVERLVSILSQEWIKSNDVKVAIFDGKNLDYFFQGDMFDLKLPAKNKFFFKILQFIRRILQLIKLFKREDPDCIISFMENANFPSIFAAYFVGKLKKLTVSVHADPANMLKIQILLIPYLYLLPNQVVAVSKGVFNALNRMGVPKKKIKIIYNPLSDSTPSIFKILPIPVNAPNNYILGVGRLDKQKGFDKLIEAFSNIPHPGLKLVILGEGEERKNLENIISNKNLADSVYLLGQVDDVWPWYRYAKCFVSSSLSESWGNVMVESMSQGCPVVAFDCHYGPREIITDGFNGFLIKINDLDNLTNAIITLLSDKHLSDKLRKNGLVRSSEFDAKALSKQWLKNI